MPASANLVRREQLASLREPFDVLVIGGGATGLGIALDAVTRGFRTALVEAGDFAQATSSRSTKLVHGGVRYLASGQIHLVREALQERAVMRQIAPHLVHSLPTVLPATHLWQLPFYGSGLTVYNLMSGSSSMGPTKILSRRATLARVPGLAAGGLRGGILYHDAQFNDARFALAVARTAVDRGATVLNYVRCLRFLYNGAKQIAGAVVREMESGQEIEVSAEAVINATGIFSDEIRTMDETARPPLLSVSRGTHIVVPGRFLGGTTAVMVPKTDDGRVIFAIPWEDLVLIGTTDIPAKTSEMEPGFEEDEIGYLLKHVEPYLAEPVSQGDILSVFSGLRPLVTGKENTTSKLSREHHIDRSQTGLITVAGGKWTTYRRMAQDTLNFAGRQGLLPEKPCVTRGVALRGSPSMDSAAAKVPHVLAEYGTDARQLEEMMDAEPSLREPLDPALPYNRAMVSYAVREEFARTVEDVLSRRTRSLMLDAHAALRAAPEVAKQMARELGHDEAWASRQSVEFQALTRRHYLPSSAEHGHG